MGRNAGSDGRPTAAKVSDNSDCAVDWINGGISGVGSAITNVEEVPFVFKNEEEKIDVGVFAGEFFEGIFAREIGPEIAQIYLPIIEHVEPADAANGIKEEDISFGSSIMDGNEGELYVRVVTLLPEVIDISSESDSEI